MAEEPMNFEDYMDGKLEGVALAPDPVTPEPTPEPTPAATPVAETPVVAEETTPGLSDKLTKLLAGEKPDAAKEAIEEPDPEDKPPENATPAAQSRWAQMRQDQKWRKQNEPVLTQLQKDLEALRAEKAKTPAEEATRQEEIKRVRDERDALMKELQVSRVEATPEFREHIEKPINNILEQGKLLAKKYELSENSVLGALREADTERQGELLTELVATFNERDKVRLFTMGDQVADYQRQGTFIRENAKVALEALNRSNDERRKAETLRGQEDWKQALDVVGADFKAKLPLMQMVEGEDEWNKGTAHIEEIVRTADFTNMPAKHRAQILYQAAVLPRALVVQQTLLAENASLKKRLAKINQQTPGAGDGTPATTSSPSISSDLGFLDAVEAVN